MRDELLFSVSHHLTLITLNSTLIPPMIWFYFLALIAVLLVFDLGILGRTNPKSPSLTKALIESSVWVAIGLAFSGIIFYVYEKDLFGPDNNTSGITAFIQYLTGYILELTLSVDNLFVIALIMAYFKIPSKYQHTILFWGIVGVLVTRGILITMGYQLVSHFDWVNYLFGAILLFSAYKMATTNEEKTVDYEKSGIIKFLKRFVKITSQFDGNKFFTFIHGRKAATPILVTLLVVETTDIFFAFDSVPAVFSITRDPFLVFSSNIFAILGLRALYFVLAASMDKFRYLETALIVILTFIGLKMIGEHWIHISVGISLVVVAISLAVGIIASLVSNKK